MAKKLYRSEDNAIAGGVLGGVAEYYEIDPVIIRLIAIIIAIVTGIIPFALVYLLSVLVIPKKHPFGTHDTPPSHDEQTRA